MKTLLLALITVGLCGCHSIKIGDAKVWSMGQKVTIGEISYDTKTGELKVSNYNNDQVQGLNAVAEGVAKGVVAGMKP